jgi:dTDP-4-amino-4,6-dideoxygalactose transaminase
MNIPFSPPDFTELEIQAVADAMRSGWITTGPRTKLFEKKLAEFFGTSTVVCLNSATAAMELVLRVLRIGPGDEVITSAYTYTASASVIDHVGAKVVLVDTEPGSFFIDPDGVAAAITENTKAIIPVDIGGVMVDYDRILGVVNSKKHLFKPANDIQAVFDRPIVMADAAHSIGASHKNRMSGSVADFSAFSFHAVKNLTTAEGGAVTWVDRDGIDNDALYREFQLLSLHGQSKDALLKMTLGAWEYDIVFPGYKCNMTDLTSALGLAQLSRFPELMKRRLEIIQAYDNALLPAGVLSMSHFGESFQGNGHLYLSRIPGATEAQRNAIITKMAEKGIACNVHFKPLPLFTAYRNLGFSITDYPNAFSQYTNEITLPSHTLLTDEMVEYVHACFIRSIEEVVH